jgi:hypothetical protein
MHIHPHPLHNTFAVKAAIIFRVEFYQCFNLWFMDKIIPDIGKDIRTSVDVKKRGIIMACLGGVRIHPGTGALWCKGTSENETS